MWILSWIVIGAIARAILPGRAAGGWLVSLVVGIVGAFVGSLVVLFV